MQSDHTSNEEPIKYFCDNIRLRNTDEYFQMQLESGGTQLVFSLTPEHAKRMALALSHHIALFEKLHRPIKTSWAPDIASPFKPQDLAKSLPEDIDELYNSAKKLVIASKQASPSFIQTKLKITYARAQHLITLLEENGIVSATDGMKPRKVLIKEEKRKKQS